jgi:2'-5' RNA ligase
VPGESAIVLPTPDAEPIVGAWRARHDPSAARGVPAHITLLYPFAPAAAAESELDGLREICGSIGAFTITLTEVRRFPSTAYLHPEPFDELVRITALLTGRWPAYQPYGGAFATVVPHLTFADRASQDVIEQASGAVAARLPIQCAADEAWLMCSDARGTWTRRARLPFSTGRA